MNDYISIRYINSYVEFSLNYTMGLNMALSN